MYRNNNSSVVEETFVCGCTDAAVSARYPFDAGGPEVARFRVTCSQCTFSSRMIIQILVLSSAGANIQASHIWALEIWSWTA
jgi:hypothetical protein